jgi:hypothetical protein
MAKNTIKVKKYSDVIEEYTSTAATITPGSFLELDSAGLVKKHATAGGNVIPPMVALEDELWGRGIDDAYAVSSKIQVWIPYRGDIVYALLKDGENVAIGAALESAGDGTLQAHSADTAGAVEYPNAIVGVALEAVDLSGSANETAGRILVRIV